MKLMPSKVVTTIMLAMLVSGLACTSKLYGDLQADSHADPSFDPKSVHSFIVAPALRIVSSGGTEIRRQPEPMDSYLRDLVARGLVAHGLVAESHGADARVQLTVRAEVVKEQGLGERTSHLSLDVEIVRLADKVSVWSGRAQGVPWDNIDEATAKKRVEYAIGKMLERYPR